LTSDARVIEVPGGARFEVAPHRCFACGTLNTQGMGLELHVERDRSWTELSLEPRFQGWDGIAHGGILCTILDEVMAWSLAGADNWGVTARMNVEFRKPVPLDTPLRADGWITRERRRIIDTAGRIVDRTTGTEYARATGVYVAADETRKAELRARYRFRPPVPGSAAALSPVDGPSTAT
jgi:acyl-coenzyme A thioesterase PaaI-like protein